jgi:hypothetical protein
MGKMTAKARKRIKRKMSKAPFEQIYLDLKVVNEPSYGGALYLLVIVDDYSSWRACILTGEKTARPRTLDSRI